MSRHTLALYIKLYAKNDKIASIYTIEHFPIQLLLFKQFFQTLKLLNQLIAITNWCHTHHSFEKLCKFEITIDSNCFGYVLYI